MVEQRNNERITELQQESKEAKETILRELLIKALKEGIKINEGNNGIIVKVKGEGLDQEIKKINPKFEGQPLVSKLFKVNSVAEVSNEFDVMSEARNVLDIAIENNPEIEYAKIPKAHVNYNLTNLDSEMVDALSTYGVPAREGGSISVIVMDAIEGKDLNTILFEEVIKRHSKLKEREDLKLENLSFKGLAYEVQVALGFVKPSVANTENRLLDRENIAKVADFFGIGKGKAGEGVDFQLPKDFFSKIKKTIDLLNKSGIYHRDLHERNIMFDKNGEVFIIDFGMALNNKDVVDPYFSSLKGGEFNRDGGLVEFWQGLSEDRSEAGLKEKKKGVVHGQI